MKRQAGLASPTPLLGSHGPTSPGAGDHRLPRVLYLTDLHPADKFGSLEEQILLLAQAFQRQGGVLLPVFGAPLGAASADQYAAFGLPADALDLHNLSFGTLQRLLQLIHRHRITLLHWNFYNPFNPYVLILSVLVPRLVHYFTDHNSRIHPVNGQVRTFKTLAKRLLFTRYRKILCVSDFVLNAMKTNAGPSNLQRCTHFINTDRFRPDASARTSLRRELGGDGRFIAIFVAALIRWKGADVAIKALADLPESVVLWIVGDGPEAAPLRSLRDELALTDRVRFFGTQRYVQPYMQAADCLVYPSVWGEAAGLAILEGLACELPVVASAIGGIPEFVADGQTGFLFPPGNHHLLAQRLGCLLDNPDLRRRMGRAARLTALEQFSIERRLLEHVEFYRPAAIG